MTTTARITDIFDLPSSFDAITSDLEEVLGRIGISDFSLNVQLPPVTPGDASPVPPITKDDALGLLADEGDEGDEGDEFPPPVGNISQDVIPCAPSASTTVQIQMELEVLSDIVINLAGLDGISLVLNPAGFTAQFTTDDTGFALSFSLGAAIRFAPNLLRPYRKVTQNNGEITFERDESRPYTQINLANVDISIDHTGSIDLNAGAGIQLTDPMMIGDTGLIIENADIVLSLSGAGPRPDGTPPGWKGVMINEASLRIPDVFSGAIIASGLGIGSGGVSGTLSATFGLSYDNGNFTGDLVGEVFGMQGGLRDISLTLQQNIPAGGGIKAQLRLPFFEDTEEPLDIDIGFTLVGRVTVAVDRPTGLITLRKLNLLDLTVESLDFVLNEGVFTVSLSGDITPQVGGLEWPAFRVEELSIDSQGNVRVEGGWLNLRKQYVLNFYGFQLEITKIGFGTTDAGQHWIGFNGGLKLVQGLTAGASVQGMRILWDPTKDLTDPSAIALTLDGVGVELNIPKVLYFKGGVAMTQPSPGVFRFDGNITLSVGGLTIEGQIVIGYDSVAEYTFFAIYVGLDLPAGIPLGQSGAALYGMAGLFALNMEPGRLPEEAWYAIQPAPSWYHKETVGVSDLRKWKNEFGSLALGAGVTLGTFPDNGLSFNGRLLVVMVLPGPVLMIEGRTNILKERASLRDEPLFRTLAVIDGRESTCLVGIDAQYKVDDEGALIDIGGGSEAFFNFNKAEDWHLYLGIDEPRDRRVRAQFFKGLFEANSYLMINPSGIRTGAWIGYDKSWNFGALNVSLEGWIEGAANLSAKPQQFQGSLWLHGAIDAEIFGFGFALGADARLTTEAFAPLHLQAELSISLDLPWPGENVSETILLEWGPLPTLPQVPVPLKEVAIAHLKVTTSWPLPPKGATLLRPDIDPDSDGFLNGFWEDTLPALSDDSFPAGAPVVPLDARPQIMFGRPVHDLARIGVNSSPANPDTGGWEWIGDPKKGEGPARFKVSLLQVALEKRVGNSWQTLASKGQGNNVDKIFGSWAPTPQLPGGNPAEGSPAPTANTKLWLWSRSPFDFTQRTNGEWEEWFMEQYPNHPCIPIPPDQEICCDFSSLAIGTAPIAPWICPQHPQIVFGWRTSPTPQVKQSQQAGVVSKRLSFEPGSEVLIYLTHEVKRLSISGIPSERKKKLECIDFAELQNGRTINPIKQEMLTFEGRDALGKTLAEIRLSSNSINNVPLRGLVGWSGMEIRLLEASAMVELEVSHNGVPVQAKAFDSKGNLLGSKSQQIGPKILEKLRLEFPSNSGKISSIILTSGSESYLHRLCYQPDPYFPVFAQALDVSHQPLKKYSTQDGPLEIDGKGVRSVLVSSRGGSFDLTKVCVTEGLTDEERREREAMQRSIVSGLAHWKSIGEVLPPWSQFRLKIVTSLQVQTFGLLNSRDKTKQITQYAYFRTEGPPGLSQAGLPVGNLPATQAPTTAKDAPAFDSGLNDLTHYVAQTIPPTVPNQRGEKPLLPRPVYCAYDVGVKFNENYVEHMYAISGRNLSLYLFDNNNLPVRDANNRLFTPINRWRRQATLSLSPSEQRWLEHLNSTTCKTTIDLNTIPKDQDLQSSGHILAADTLYEARLIPVQLESDTITTVQNAPVVYSFKFTTSRFADFTHHVHSFRNLVFRSALADLNGVSTAVTAAVDLASSLAQADPTPAEVNAYEMLSAKALGTASHQKTDGLDITRIEHNGKAICLLIRTGEPIDWRRTTLKFSQTGQPQQLVPQPPEGLRAITVGFASGSSPQPNSESVLILLNEALDLTGWQIEWRPFPRTGTDADSEWNPWYTFGNEPLRALGQRVRVFAGQGINSPSPSPEGEEVRFRNAPTTEFKPSFPSTGVDLRLVRPDGYSAHMRRFLPDGDYSEKQAKMLRSADGTGIILFGPDTTVSRQQLKPGEYRLRWEYRRDNTKLDQTSLVLSQNGRTSPEVTVIDIPWSTFA
jgi:hypothetical protein